MNPPVSLPNGGPRQAEPKLHPVRGLGRAVFVYFIAVFASILLAAVFDNFFVLPPVEVDEALSLVNTAPAALTMVRNIGAYALPTTVNVSFLTVYVWPVLSFLGNTKDEEPSASVLTRVIRAPQVVATVALVGWTSSYTQCTAPRSPPRASLCAWRSVGDSGAGKPPGTSILTFPSERSSRWPPASGVPAFLLHQAPREEEYLWNLTIDDPPPNLAPGNFIYLQVRQKNSQWAWGSLSFVG
jgi:hypothetical protein